MNQTGSVILRNRKSFRVICPSGNTYLLKEGISQSVKTLEDLSHIKTLVSKPAHIELVYSGRNLSQAQSKPKPRSFSVFKGENKPWKHSKAGITDSGIEDMISRTNRFKKEKTEMDEIPDQSILRAIESMKTVDLEDEETEDFRDQSKVKKKKNKVSRD